MRDNIKRSVISVFVLGLLLILAGCPNPELTLSLLTPDTKVYHMPSFTLTVNGTNFTSDTVIVFNNIQKPTTLVSSTEMTCQIDPTDIAVGPASLPVLVKDTVSGKESNILYFTVDQYHTFSTPGQASQLLSICGYSNYTKISVDDEKNVNIVWGECLPAHGYGFVYFIRSEDMGLTWINSQELPDKSYWGNFFPVMALDSSANINIVYTKQTQGWGTYDLIFVRSQEGQGVSWTGPLNLSSGWAQWSKYSDIGIGFYNGIENIALVFNSLMGASWGNIYFIYSSDSGITWSLPTNVCHNPDDSGMVRMALDSNGQIYVVWLELSKLTNNLYRRIFFNQSSDFGQTWGNPVLMSPNHVERIYPDVEIGESGHIYMVWVEEENEANQVLFRTSNDSGNTWSEPVNLAETTYPNRIMAYIAADNAGNVNLIYINDDGCFFRRSVDRGASWESVIPIPLPPTGGADITLDDEGNIYLTVTDRNAVYFIHSHQ